MLAAAQQAPGLASPIAALGYTCDELRYPFAALRAEASGKTVVSFVVSESGAITEPAVIASAGRKREHKLLDHVALAHLRSCRQAAGTSLAPGAYTQEFVWLIR